MTWPADPIRILHVVDASSCSFAFFERWQKMAPWTVRTWTESHRFLECAALDAHGCLVLDLDPPERHGFSLVASLRGRCDMPVVCTSRRARILEAAQDLDTGIRVLVKPVPAKVMRHAVAQAMATNWHRPLPEPATPDMTSPELANRGHGRPRSSDPECLTPRQRDVWSLAARGYPTKRIATELQISPKTVEVHLAQIFGAGRE